MATKTPLDLSRRERQIMSVLYRLGPRHRGRGPGRAAEAAQLQRDSGPPPGPGGQGPRPKHEDDGTRYVFRPTVPRDRARRGALHDMVHTFFDGSASQAVAALLDADPSISKAELDRLMKLIEQARAEGR